MKVQTTTLKGPALDYAVALAEGCTFGKPRPILEGYLFPMMKPGWATVGAVSLLKHNGEWVWGINLPRYSTMDAYAGPIIDREHLSTFWFGENDGWRAYIGDAFTLDAPEIKGDSRMEAAMLVWALHKLGPEIDIPDELMVEAA